MAAPAGHNIELPHTSSGETDWNTLGNILTAKILGEVLCASYVDRAYGQGNRNFNPDTDWKFMYKEDGVTAFQKSFKDSPIKAFMGRGVIDRPMEDIVHYLEDHEKRKEWDRYLVEIRQVKAMSEHDFILYMQVVTNKCLVKFRGDFVQYERMTYVDDKYVRTVMSVELPEFPAKPPVVRGELYPGTGWVLEPYDGSRTRTLVSFLAHIDLKIPPIVINRIMRRQPKAIYRIRKILMSPRRRALSLDSYSHESSCDSLTASETRAMLAAYPPTQEDQRHYVEDMSIDEFIGRPDRRFQSNPPTLRYCHETDSYSVKKAPGKRLVGRSVSIDSAQKSDTRSSFGSFGDNLGTPASFKSMDSAPSNSMQSNFVKGESFDDRFETPATFKSCFLSPPGPGGVAPGQEPVGAVDIVELRINDNPVISEHTGFHGDSQLPFFTPSSSVADSSTGRCFEDCENGDMDTEGAGETQVRAAVNCNRSLVVADNDPNSTAATCPLESNNVVQQACS